MYKYFDFYAGIKQEINFTRVNHYRAKDRNQGEK